MGLPLLPLLVLEAEAAAEAEAGVAAAALERVRARGVSSLSLSASPSVEEALAALAAAAFAAAVIVAAVAALLVGLRAATGVSTPPKDDVHDRSTMFSLANALGTAAAAALALSLEGGEALVLTVERGPVGGALGSLRRERPPAAAEAETEVAGAVGT